MPGALASCLYTHCYLTSFCPTFGSVQSAEEIPSPSATEAEWLLNGSSKIEEQEQREGWKGREPRCFSGYSGLGASDRVSHVLSSPQFEDPGGPLASFPDILEEGLQGVRLCINICSSWLTVFFLLFTLAANDPVPHRWQPHKPIVKGPHLLAQPVITLKLPEPESKTGSIGIQALVTARSEGEGMPSP